MLRWSGLFGIAPQYWCRAEDGTALLTTTLPHPDCADNVCSETYTKRRQIYLNLYLVKTMQLLYLTTYKNARTYQHTKLTSGQQDSLLKALSSSEIYFHSSLRQQLEGSWASFLYLMGQRCSSDAKVRCWRGKQEHCCPAQSTPIFLSASVFANFTSDILTRRHFLSGLARKPLYSFYPFCLKFQDAQSRRGCGSVTAHGPHSQFGGGRLWL